jgi:hypothetical protein
MVYGILHVLKNEVHKHLIQGQNTFVVPRHGLDGRTREVVPRLEFLSKS